MDIPKPDFLPETPDELDGHGDLTAAEIDLVRSCLAGAECRRGSKRPEPDDRRDEITVRAALIRFLARGGNAAYQVDPRGVQLSGARVRDDLDLQACRDLRPLILEDCHLTDAPLMRDAVGQTVAFQRCHLPGLKADRLKLTGALLLRNSEVTGAVRVAGAQIGGGLDCDGAKLSGPDGMGNVLVADGARMEGNLFLRGVEAEGCLWLPGLRLGGNLELDGATLAAAKKADRALMLQVAEVAGGLFFRKLAKPPAGIVDVSSAKIGTLADDLAAWPAREDGKRGLYLDGLRYDRIIGPVDFQTRKAWHLRQVPQELGENFVPQPFEQLVKVLREMGHTEDAKRIAILKRQYERPAAWAQAKTRAAKAAASLAEAQANRRTATDPAEIARLDTRIWWGRYPELRDIAQGAVRWGLDRLFGAVVGYGYRPLYALGWLAGMVTLSGVLFLAAYRTDGMIPNDPFTLRSAEWTSCVKDRGGHPSRAACFLEAERRGSDGAPRPGETIGYPPFAAGWYALDTAVPFVDLHQEGRWVPDPGGGWLGWPARLWLYLHIALGWGITALFAASVTGIVKTDV